MNQEKPKMAKEFKFAEKLKKSSALTVKRLGLSGYLENLLSFAKVACLSVKKIQDGVRNLTIKDQTYMTIRNMQKAITRQNVKKTEKRQLPYSETSVQCVVIKISPYALMTSITRTLKTNLKTLAYYWLMDGIWWKKKLKNAPYCVSCVTGYYTMAMRG